LIQSRGRWNARAIAAELDCSERTVYRDLDVLELAGVPWSFDAGARCYRVRPDFRFPALNLTEEELLGQAAASAITAGPGLTVGAGAKATARKLAAASPDEVGKLLHDAEQVIAVLDLKLADHSRHQDILRTVQGALVRRKQLVGQYETPYQGRARQLRLHPFRLCLINQAWYLIAKPADGVQPRTYRVTRFKMLRMVDAAADVPDVFDLRQYFGDAWAVYRGERSYDVEVAFTKEAAPLVTETAWHHTQTISRHQDGSVTLGFRVDGLNEIVHWVLGWSGRARVVRPAELRTMVVTQLRAALILNQDGETIRFENRSSVETGAGHRKNSMGFEPVAQGRC
jgi:predicted DNA-binding transcriptional regulator YafY